MPTVHYVSRALLSENGLHSLQWSDPLANNNNDGNDDDLNWRAVTGDVPRKLNYPSEFASKSTVAQGKKDGTSITSSTSSFLAPHVADVSPTCRRHRQMSPNLGRHCVSLRHARGPNIPN